MQNSSCRLAAFAVLLTVGVVGGSSRGYAQAPSANANSTAADPIIGAWELNLSKSKFPRDRAPKHERRMYVASGTEIKASATGVDAAGKPISTSWTINYDGKDRVLTGIAEADSVSFKRIDARHIEFIEKKAGKVVGTGTRSFSTDGKAMTLTFKGPVGPSDHV